MRTLLAVLLVTAIFAGCTEDPVELVDDDCTALNSKLNGNPTVTLETNFGNITAEIFVDKVPITGKNFVCLAESGYYNNTKFHRIISNFMMQGGDPTATGGGGDAYPYFDNGDSNIKDEYRADLTHSQAGTLSMANTGALNSGSSQFFITFRATTHLDAYESGQKKNCGQPYVSCHAVFGQVVDGMDVVQTINAEAGSSNGAPKTPVHYISATVNYA